MKEFIEKLSSYNIFNYLLPGVLFAVFSEKITPYRVIQNDLVLTLFLCYFIGLCISRLGSLLIEPFLKWIGFIEFASYGDFVNASKLDNKIEVLSEANNMYRTLSSLFLSLCLLLVFRDITNRTGVSDKHSLIVGCVLLFLLFTLSYRKQTLYIRKRIERSIKGEKTEHG